MAGHGIPSCLGSPARMRVMAERVHQAIPGNRTAQLLCVNSGAVPRTSLPGESSYPMPQRVHGGGRLPRHARRDRKDVDALPPPHLLPAARGLCHRRGGGAILRGDAAALREFRATQTRNSTTQHTDIKQQSTTTMRTASSGVQRWATASNSDRHRAMVSNDEQRGPG
eukprot:gene376-biopygen10747